MTPPRPPAEDARMSLMEHLQELRARLIRVVVAVLGLGVLSLVYAREIFALLMRPVLDALPEGERALVYTSGIEEINVLLKVGLYAGIFLAAPVALFQLWQFVAPGLMPRERKFVGPFVAFGTLFFVAGGLFCYSAVLPTMFSFLLRPGESAPMHERVDTAGPLADDARRLLVAGDSPGALKYAQAVVERLSSAGEGQLATPALSPRDSELKDRIGNLGKLFDALALRPNADPLKLKEAAQRLGEAQSAFSSDKQPEAVSRLDEAAAALTGAFPADREVLTALWKAEEHLAAARSQLRAEEWTRPMLSMREQLSLVLLLEVAFGAIFELPLVMALLAVVGILKFKTIAPYQRHAILACTALAAAITPSGDAVNLALMAVPMIVCFELGLLFVWIFEKRRAAQAAEATDAAAPTN